MYLNKNKWKVKQKEKTRLLSSQVERDQNRCKCDWFEGCILKDKIQLS